MCHWEEGDEKPRPRFRLPNPMKSLKILVRKDNAVIILACGLLYAVYTCICASLSVLFIDIYKLNQLQAGLIYIPFGFGGTASSFVCGPLLNKAYRQMRIKRGLSTDKAVGDDLDTFPIEKARLLVIWIPMVVTILCVVAFGWTLHFHLHMAIPLCLQFILGLAMQLDFSIYNTLLVDKNNRTPAAAQASSNIVRCGLAAIVVAFLQNLIDAIGIGWTFTFMGALCVMVMGLFFVDYRQGMIWRQKYCGVSEASPS